MHKLIHFILVAGIFNVASSHAYATEPKDVLASFITALEQGDKAKITEVLSPNFTVYESGYVERTRAEYESHHMNGDMQFAKTSTQKILKQTEKREGNLTVIWQETETKAKLKGQDVTILGATTVVLQKTAGKWVITHVHWSSRKPQNN
jgi:ketosteroid isomerase-like protein